jgi:hypothetical protein
MNLLSKSQVQKFFLFLSNSGDHTQGFAHFKQVFYQCYNPALNSLCSPDWPQAGDSSDSTSKVLGLPVCATTPSSEISFI